MQSIPAALLSFRFLYYIPNFHWAGAASSYLATCTFIIEFAVGDLANLLKVFFPHLGLLLTDFYYHAS